MSKKIKILLAEDDANLGNLLCDYLKAKGYHTVLAANGEETFSLFVKGEYSLCLLDVMMPIKDGFTVAKEIRKINKKVPIIFLTAKSMKEDTLEGFELGADDYITKPFSMEELLARIGAVLRRSEGDHELQDQSVFNIGKFSFDSQKRILSDGGIVQKLTSKENDLLRLLCLNEGKVLERTYALKAIWEDDNYFSARSMDVYIAKLRKHLKGDSAVEIVNVHGRGFRFIVHK
jgi:DNA-binding response OmpR family regulator